MVNASSILALPQTNTNTMETIENNKLIAEFMGCKVTIFKGKEYIRLINEPYVYMTNGMDEPDDMLFHDSWDWLMPCIGKISNQCEEPENLDGLKYALLCNDINTAYKIVIDYITQ